MKNRFIFLAIIFSIIIGVISCKKDDDTIEDITISVNHFITSIDENPDNGQIIGIIEASTNIGVVIFSFSEQHPADAMSLNPVTGQLSVADPSQFDFEENRYISGSVVVSNGDVSKRVNISVEIINLWESDVFEGNMFLRTQQEIIDFGANNYSIVTGKLYIDQSDNLMPEITDLTPLSSINKCGEINILNCSTLGSLNGLDNLTTVSEVNIITVSNLQDIDALSNCKMVYLSIRGCCNLENLNSINSERIKYLSIRNNDNLIDLEALSGITNLDAMDIIGNEVLENLNGIRNVETLNRLVITDNISLMNIDGLQNIEVLNKLTIDGNTSLTNINGLDGVTVIEDLYISNNDLLESVGNISLNQTMNSLKIDNNDAILDLSGLYGAVNVMQITLSNNEALTSLQNFSSLQQIKTLEVSNNDNITTLEGLHNIQFIDYAIIIKQNDRLHSLEHLENIQFKINFHDIEIIGNNSLTTLNGLESLSSTPFIEYRLIDNLQLVDFCDLNANYIQNNYPHKILGNAYNPSIEDLQGGNCSL